MVHLSYRRHRFPLPIIQHAMWLYLRFTLSYRDVEDLLAERGLDVSYETVRRWVLKFGPTIARNLRQRRPRPSDQWHLDEMVVRIAGKHMYLWRAVDHEGEVLDMLVQHRRDKRAALRLMRKLLRKRGFAPKSLTTDKLGSYRAAFRHLGLTCHHEQGLRKNNRAANSHQTVRRRERKMHGSSQPDRPSVSSASMPQSTTPSTSSATSSPDRRCGHFEPRHRRSGKLQSLQREASGAPTGFPLSARYRDNALTPPEGAARRSKSIERQEWRWGAR